MITLRKSEERRHVRRAGQDCWRTFDPGLGFRTLNFLNEERLSPGRGFPVEVPEDAEILTYVLEGTLVEEDASGGKIVLHSGECRRSRASSGFRPRMINPSATDVAHAFQSSFTSSRKDARPGVEQKRFPFTERRGILRLTASPDGKDGSLRLDQDLRIYSALLDPGHHLIHELAPGRGAWIHVVKGRIQLVDLLLGTGDGASVVDEAAVSWTARERSEILLFDLA